jgi:flagellar protein FliO/FliZ
VLTWIIIFVLLAGAVVLGAWLLRGNLSGSASALFGGPARERRLDVVEHASVDGRRRLVLIRRDDVEHLIMTGGPVDVVIETNIGGARVPERPRLAPVEGVGDRVTFGRQRGERQVAES